MQAAARIAPGSAPRVLAHDDSGVFAMEFLDRARHRLWKDELRAGRADEDFAARVGRTLARIHAATAGDAAIAAAFATDAGFHAIRLEPYLLATARRHPDLGARLAFLAERTGATRAALVHGDVSPKNILAGPGGPVFLDAECAWYGDPAFDLAFCLNHLLLKCLWVPSAAGAFLRCFDALAAGYLGVFAPPGLEARAATLLPGLLLARVDGKSPVEYLAEERQKERVRAVARALLENPPDTLGAVRAAWQGS
jgi:aminoglycoside phosphotransferase (APT) family kinase protein